MQAYAYIITVATCRQYTHTVHLFASLFARHLDGKASFKDCSGLGLGEDRV